MIKIVQGIFDNMKDEAPPSATVVAEARTCYQEMLNDGDDGDNNNNNNGAATPKKGGTNSKSQMEHLVASGQLVTVPHDGGSGGIFPLPSGSSSGSVFSMWDLQTGEQVVAGNSEELPSMHQSLAGVAVISFFTQLARPQLAPPMPLLTIPPSTAAATSSSLQPNDARQRGRATVSTGLFQYSNYSHSHHLRKGNAGNDTSGKMDTAYMDKSSS